MERNEAIICLKEILRLDSSLSPEAVTFQTPKDSAGYTLHIKGAIQQSDKELVEQIAQKRNLAVEQEKDGITIFKPSPPPQAAVSSLF
jgi:hypothetical protein